MQITENDGAWETRTESVVQRRNKTLTWRALSPSLYVKSLTGLILCLCTYLDVCLILIKCFLKNKVFINFVSTSRKMLIILLNVLPFLKSLTPIQLFRIYLLIKNLQLLEAWIETFVTVNITCMLSGVLRWGSQRLLLLFSGVTLFSVTRPTDGRKQK